MAPRPDSLLAGLERVDDVLSYEFMADFRVHARLRRPSDESKDGDPEEEVVKAAYLTLPPAVGMSAIAPSCYSCFDYTNGLADLVVGYMGAPFDGRVDEMTRAPLMVTVRNNRGARMLDTAVGADRVHVILDGGYAGTHLPSHGDRTSITLQTVRGDSLVRSLTDATFIPATQGAPMWFGDILASIIAQTLPKGLEFARYSIDYHYLRNQLYVEEALGIQRALQHVPRYAMAIQSRYKTELEVLRTRRQARKTPMESDPLPHWLRAICKLLRL